MKVELLSHQPHALELLLYTKNTRLRGGVTLADIREWPMEKKLEHLSYMRDTIQSSWEFAYYVFEITGVTRAFTHQLVRTRTASYAQESQRTVEVRNATWLTPELEDPGMFDGIMVHSVRGYEALLAAGVPAQDARGVLPTNIQTSIVVGANLRTLHDMAEKRLCTRTQGEYQDVFSEMKARVVEVHPWAEEFIQVFCMNHGTCCFPRYKECPIQQYTLNGTQQDYAKTAVKQAFSAIRHEARPKAKDGRTM